MNTTILIASSIVIWIFVTLHELALDRVGDQLRAAEARIRALESTLAPYQPLK